MYIKRGTIEESILERGPILTSPKGKRYEVSFIASYIWGQLNGNKPLQEVVHDVQQTAQIEGPQLFNVAQEIIKDLKKVGLVEEVQVELNKR